MFKNSGKSRVWPNHSPCLPCLISSPERVSGGTFLWIQPYLPSRPVVAFMTDGDQTDVIYIDYSSAFTSVNHALLLYKLQKSYHLSGAALSWFRSYLSGREQCVVLDGQCSDWVPVRSGVPEGSICGPILFVLFCNDVPTHISSECLMYADDLKLYRQIRSPGDALLLQTDLDSLHRWSIAWKLSLNPSKYKTITFSLRKKSIESSYMVNNITLERVTEMRDLGILFDSKLTFGPHIDSVVVKANRALGMYIPAFSPDLPSSSWPQVSTGSHHGWLQCPRSVDYGVR